MDKSNASIQALNENRAKISDKTMKQYFDQHPDQVALYSKDWNEKSIRDINYHLDYLIEAMINKEPTLFTSYVLWCRTLFEKIGLPEHVLTETLSFLKYAIQSTLEPEHSIEPVELFDRAIQELNHTTSDSKPFLNENNPNVALCKSFLEALLRGDRASASKMVLNAIENGTPLKDIYIDIFQQSQYEVGRLWQTNQINVAQEHYCTAATQMIMSQLYPYLFTNKKQDKVFVSACVVGELHEIGIRMVTDLLELDGWDTYYLGANTPIKDVVGFLIEKKADVLGISTTMTFNIPKIRELISHVRSVEGLKHLKIMVGGYPFLITENLWKQLGADGCASNALEAIEVTNGLSKGRYGDDGYKA